MSGISGQLRDNKVSLRPSIYRSLNDVGNTKRSWYRLVNTCSSGEPLHLILASGELLHLILEPFQLVLKLLNTRQIIKGQSFPFVNLVVNHNHMTNFSS